jgi:exopolysaccharide biosynthesis polyprenyl glycosylphosphotransferase
MSEQTATTGLTAAPRALELHPPRSVDTRRRPERIRLAARLSIDVGSILCAALAVQASAAVPLHSWTIGVAAVAIIAGYAIAGLYSLTAPPKLGTELLQVLSVPALVTMALAGIELAFGRQDVGDAAVRFWLLAATMTGAGRLTVNGAQALLRRGAPTGRANTLIVGAGRVGHLAAKRLLDEPALGMRPIGFLDKDPLGPRPDAETHVTLPVLGASYDLEQVVREHDVEYVLVAFSTAPSHVVLDMVRRCWALGVSVMLVPRLYEVEGKRARTEHLGALPVVTLSPADPRGWQFTGKYVADRIVAALALLIVAPLFAVVALAILITSGRPILFRQRRVGRDGHVFEMLKFRTMRGTPEVGGELDAEWAAIATGMGPTPDVGAEAVTDDRRTGLGSLLRKLSIDELPQLWNVLRGDMSIVGPRPERVHYVELFEQAIYRYPDRHRVKSGLTGWAQVNGLRGETSLADRIEWDNFYIENWSPWLDLKIILKTIPALAAGRGAR